MCQKEDNLYVKTSTFDEASNCLRKHGMVVLTGRKGSGKSKMCLELEFLFKQDDFQSLRVELDGCDVKKLNSEKLLYIIDDVKFNAQGLAQLKKILSLLSYPKDRWIAITCMSESITSLKDTLMDSEMFKEECVIDINNNLTDEEKKRILEVYFKANNITLTSSLQESNYRSNDILTQNIHVKVDTETIEKIVKSNPYYGFPLTVAEFCADRSKLHLGERYFTNAPKDLLDKVQEMYRRGKNRQDKKEVHEYCILVHIATKGYLDVDDINTDEYQKMTCNIFGKMYLIENIKDLKKVADSMCGVFVEYKAKKYELIFPGIAKAVCMSSDYCAKNYLIGSGSFYDIRDCVRSFNYKPDENELVYKLDNDEMYSVLCNRLVSQFCKNRDLACEIYQYMYTDFIKLRDIKFVEKLFSILYNSHFASHLPGKLPITSVSQNARNSSKEKTKGKPNNLDNFIPILQIIKLLDGLTDCGQDSWIFCNEALKRYPYVQCGLIAAFISVGKEVLASLLTIFKECLNDKNFVRSLDERFDTYGNTFFHYLPLFCDAESCKILNIAEDKLKNKGDKFFIRNNQRFTPVAIAAFMGKQNVFKIFFNTKNNKETDKLNLNKQLNKLEDLTQITTDGINYYYKKRQSSTMFDITVNVDSDVLAFAKCGSEKDYKAIKEIIKQSKIEIQKILEHSS